MSDADKKSSEAPDTAELYVDIGTIAKITSSANTLIDEITTRISKKIGSELDAAERGAQGKS
jgi:hypothetical protein